MTQKTKQNPNQHCRFCRSGMTCEHGYCDLCQSPSPECTDDPDRPAPREPEAEQR